MARLPRLVIPGTPMHLIQRGNNRSAAFIADGDYACYAAMLMEASQRFGCAIHAYVLMTNHVHLLLTPGDESAPARMMQTLGRMYVPYVNARYRRTGTLWEGRYRSTVVDSENYLLACSRYIELNPVRARMVADPSQYRWSSYRCNAQGHDDGLITPHERYRSLDSGAAARQKAYRTLFERQLELETLGTIRRATNRGSVLGHAAFRQEVQAALRDRVTRVPHGGDRRSEMFQSDSRGIEADEINGAE